MGNSSVSSRLRVVADALDERIGYRAIVRAAGDQAVAGGASASYVFGSALIVTFLIQAVTGVALSTVYATWWMPAPKRWRYR